jgi:hypothetical protein
VDTLTKVETGDFSLRHEKMCWKEWCDIGMGGEVRTVSNEWKDCGSQKRVPASFVRASVQRFGPRFRKVLVKAHIIDGYDRSGSENGMNDGR